jgi:uncharacterized damage-inducible protein DinB
MNLIEIFKNELELEALITRKMLAVIPNDSYDWQPHAKSMTITRLATHVAEIPGWIALALTTDELDFANAGEHTFYSNTQDILGFFEESVADAKARLDAATEDDLQKPWTMRNGEQIYFTQTKAEVIRMSFSQLIHHRAQLGVFLRLLDVPIPGSYGPSADEMEMVF